MFFIVIVNSFSINCFTFLLLGMNPRFIFSLHLFYPGFEKKEDA